MILVSHPNNIMKTIVTFILLVIASCNAMAGCQWTSFQSNGVYAYGFEVGVSQTGNGITSIQLFLGTFIATMASTSDTITYNGQTYQLGALRDTGCLGKNCASMRYEYEACTVAPAVSYSYTAYNHSTSACPATQPSGQINIQQSYEVWSDGSTRNASAWYETSRSCVAVKSSTQTQSRSYSCPAGQSGAITESRTYDVWSDGSNKNFSAWSVSGNTCTSAPLTANPIKRVELCQEGYTGKITYHWVVYYTNDSYSATDEDGKLITYVLSTPHQQELVESNTCTLVPGREVETKPGSDTMTCDIFYNVVKGTYIGDVIRYGNYVSTYDSGGKQTSTVFNVTSADVTECKADPDKTISAESISVACDAGQSGQILKVRYVATDPAGNKTYPYGTDYTVTSNTCGSSEADVDTSVKEIFTPSGLLENLYFTSSDIIKNDVLSNYLKTISTGNWSSSEKHKLTINIDDLSSGKYDVAKISNAVGQFQSTVGMGNAEIKLVLPHSLDKLVGNGDITSAAVSNKSIALKSTQLVGKDAVITYLDLESGNSLSMPIEKQIKIPVLSSSTNSAQISAE